MSSHSENIFLVLAWSSLVCLPFSGIFHDIIIMPASLKSLTKTVKLLLHSQDNGCILWLKIYLSSISLDTCIVLNCKQHFSSIDVVPSYAQTMNVFLWGFGKELQKRIPSDRNNSKGIWCQIQTLKVGESDKRDKESDKERENVSRTRRSCELFS
jgi:hypothetical protein